MSHDEDPLDLLEDDGDGVIETILFFEEEGKKQHHLPPPQQSGCCVTLLLMVSAIGAIGIGVVKIFI